MKKIHLIIAALFTFMVMETTSVQAQGKDDDNPKQEKKGMSKKGKGAIIGGVGGAVGGAVIGGKKGAVIGGAAGTAGGAAVGRKKDKKKDPERYEEYSDKNKKD